ncbi:MAG TPA: nucleotide sugar dehydrogenase [Terriglobales bacterium]|nr:nucleotide sugar dehydrogenase [Terriglobales bacterium]
MPNKKTNNNGRRTFAPSGKFDVCIVGGAGHVGAPLAIVMASKGLRTLIYDINRDAMKHLAAGDLPFFEEDGEPLLKRVLADGLLCFTDNAADVKNVRHVVLTVGTPIDEFHNPVLRAITDCIDTLLPYISDNQTILLRSTVFPGVTSFLQRYLESRGKRPKVAFCPERIVQGHAVKEMTTLPQIVSGTTPEAEAEAAQLFSRIAPKIVRMQPMEAEFAKLFCNAYRYIQFAATNQFYMIAESASVSYARILEGMKQDYPRMRDLPGPGFAAGPCLMKDTMQLFAFSNSKFMLGHIAMITNEGLPDFLVEKLKVRYDLTRTRVGILGMAFKADIDDTRESLSYKLGKILRFYGAEVLCSDEFVRNPDLVKKEQLISSCDVVVVAVPHSAYKDLAFPDGVEVIDLWDITANREAAVA